MLLLFRQVPAKEKKEQKQNEIKNRDSSTDPVLHQDDRG
jgi:hypothetical protein